MKDPYSLGVDRQLDNPCARIRLGSCYFPHECIAGTGPGRRLSGELLCRHGKRPIPIVDFSRTVKTYCDSYARRLITCFVVRGHVGCTLWSSNQLFVCANLSL